MHNPQGNYNRGGRLDRMCPTVDRLCQFRTVQMKSPRFSSQHPLKMLSLDDEEASKKDNIFRGVDDGESENIELCIIKRVAGKQSRSEQNIISSLRRTVLWEQWIVR